MYKFRPQTSLSTAIADAKSFASISPSTSKRWKAKFQSQFFRALQTEAAKAEKKEEKRAQLLGGAAEEKGTRKERETAMEHALDAAEAKILLKPAKRKSNAIRLARYALSGATLLSITLISFGRLIPEVEKIVEANLNFEFTKPATQAIASGFKGMLTFLGLPVRSELSNAAFNGAIGTSLSYIFLRVGPLQHIIRSVARKKARKIELFEELEAGVRDYLGKNWLGPKEEKREMGF